MFKKGDRVKSIPSGEEGIVASDYGDRAIVAFDDGSSGVFLHQQIEPIADATDTTNPNHYKVGGMEVIDILKAKLTPEQFKGFLVGNALKYLFRCDHKNGQEDLDKALWYVTMLAGKDPRK